MKIITETEARRLQPTSDNLDRVNFCVITVSFGNRKASCLVAASIYCPWPGGRRPGHESKFQNGWGAGYNTRTAYIDAIVYLRSKLGLWTSLADLLQWHASLHVDADFVIEEHFNSLAGKNNGQPSAKKYQLKNKWLETKDEKIVATEDGISVYEEMHKQNHPDYPL